MEPGGWLPAAGWPAGLARMAGAAPRAAAPRGGLRVPAQVPVSGAGARGGLASATAAAGGRGPGWEAGRPRGEFDAEHRRRLSEALREYWEAERAAPSGRVSLRDRPKRCRLCGEEGHNALHCPNAPEEVRELLAEQREAWREARRRSMQGRPRKCSICGEVGHYAPRCPQRGVLGAREEVSRGAGAAPGAADGGWEKSSEAGRDLSSVSNQQIQEGDPASFRRENRGTRGLEAPDAHPGRKPG